MVRSGAYGRRRGEATHGEYPRPLLGDQDVAVLRVLLEPALRVRAGGARLHACEAQVPGGLPHEPASEAGAALGGLHVSR